VAERVIDNPVTGERILIRTSGSETDGRLLAFELFLPPGAHVPAGHAHPLQEERFSILEGQMRFRLGHRSLLVSQGETVVVPARTAHWFGNPGTRLAHARVEVRPALRMQELLERTESLGHAGLSGLAVFLLDFQRELAVPNLPSFVLRSVLGPLAWLERRAATRQP
jgi:mannose-6-phosphate isomerase-like protein (cupin superfamily)